jgi:hypothetical protein
VGILDVTSLKLKKHFQKRIIGSEEKEERSLAE